MSNSLDSKAIEIKISTVPAVSALLSETDLAVLDARMRELTGGASDYFDRDFAIVDFSNVAGDTRGVDWPGLIALFRSYGLNPVGVRNAPAGMEEEICALGLSIDNAAVPREVFVPAEPQRPAPLPARLEAPVEARDTMVIDTPVRAGQRVYAQGRDLIVTAAVNSGAEIIADGSIHVYAPLRGRALAGAAGHTGARIFSMCMEAELLSIAGFYRTFEDGLSAQIKSKPAQVRLLEDRLDLQPMSAALRS